jgi:sulfur carrier protein
MQLTVNGTASEVAHGLSLPALLESLGLVVGSVVVELNGTALLRSEVLSTSLADGDVLELVKAVAGG